MSEIWEEKYNSPEYGLETEASFRYFQRIITEFTPPFNLRVCAEKFIEEEFERKNIVVVDDENFNNISTNLQQNYISHSKYEKRVKSRHKTLRTYSGKFHYQERFKAYYDYFVKRNQENKLLRIAEWEAKEIDYAMKRPEFVNDSLQRIHKNEELSESERARAELDNQKAYENAVNTIYTMFHGGKQAVKMDKSVDLNAKIKSEVSVSLFDKIKAKRRELDELD